MNAIWPLLRSVRVRASRLQIIFCKTDTLIKVAFVAGILVGFIIGQFSTP